MPPSPHTHLSWVLRQLHRLILQSPVLRGSVRALLFLWSQLRRHCSSWLHIPPPPPPPSLSSYSVSTIPITKSIEYDLPYTNNTSLYRDVICASTAPAPAPPILSITASSSVSPARLSSTASRDLAIPCDELELDNLSPSGCQSPILGQTPFTAEPVPIFLEGDIADVPPSGYLNDPAGGPDSNPTPPLEWTLIPIMPDAVQHNRYENYHVMCVCLQFILDSEILFDSTIVSDIDPGKKRNIRLRNIRNSFRCMCLHYYSKAIGKFTNQFR
jgi:hypothetical protein